ncbi:MAG: site-2 protease family protein [Christensenellaceae bacterium]|jgi:regulator of sigma E protease|nr:site-2 protease family protein [Christensenellaceae bacterium]
MFIGAAVLQTIGYVAIAIGALLAMIVIHEFGHYLAGRLLGFKILEFSIGFGPAIFKRKGKKNGVVFSIRPFPLGGSCQFLSEDEENDAPDAFNNKAPWKRLIVLFAGAFFNFIAALIIITLIFTFYGQILPTVVNVFSDSPNAGILMEGDAILSVNGKQMNIVMADDFQKAFSEVGESVELKVLRDGKVRKITLTKQDCVLYSYDADTGTYKPDLDENGDEIKGHVFGFNTIIYPQKINFFQALGRSFSFSFFLVGKILAAFGMLITGQIGMENAGGPITTISLMTTAASSGFSVFSYVICLISANLAVMNLMPLPALDGSRMVFCLIEWIFKKPVKKNIEAAIHLGGFFLLIGFAVFADVFRILTVGL